MMMMMISILKKLRKKIPAKNNLKNHREKMMVRMNPLNYLQRKRQSKKKDEEDENNTTKKKKKEKKKLIWENRNTFI